VTDLSYTPTFVTRPGYVIEVADPATHPDSYGRTTSAVDTLVGPTRHTLSGQPQRPSG
jgi:hypothetical protein